jgi:hypothetical protein
MMKKKVQYKKDLLKLNVIFTLLLCVINLVIFFFIDSSKENFTHLSAYSTGALFFIYLITFTLKIKKDILNLKKEAFYVNYPISIAILFALLLFVLVINSLMLFVVNKDAMNLTSIFTLFMSTISMLFPSILFVIFVFFIIPAVILPTLNIKPNSKAKPEFIISLLFFIFLAFCGYSLVNKAVKTNNFEAIDKFKSSKLAIKYSTTFLKLADNINVYSKKKMSFDKIEVPFFYTSDSFPYANYDEAESFCNSMNARVPNYLEIYHIVFDKFDTFGEKYYWTSNKDGQFDLVLHYKNMSYTIERKPSNVKPLLYCIDNNSKDYGYKNKQYFYRDMNKVQKNSIKKLTEKPFNFESLKDIIGQDKQIPPTQNEIAVEQVNKEKKLVNFSVKEVSPEVFKQLISAGYNYNPTLYVKREYETNDAFFTSKVHTNTDKIRLCYYPFTDYDNIGINKERQIWEQSFCSPSFDLINKTPVLKGKSEKDAYCYANDGRLPNIPELAAIIKVAGNPAINVKYWTNNKVKDSSSPYSDPVLVYYENSRFMKVQPVVQNTQESAYVYCIKQSQNPSKVIANYKSKFQNVEGNYYAKQRCPNCHYYEVPDTILQQ